MKYKIGSGQYGNVYTNNKKNFIWKMKTNFHDNEFLIQKMVYEVVPEHVPRPRSYSKSERILKMNSIDGKDFLDSEKKFTKQEAYNVVMEVLVALYRIQKVYPTFKHNDLSVFNIMIENKTKTPVMIDFGLSVIKGIPNEQIPRLVKDAEVTDKPNRKYDAHLFLNSIFAHAKNPELKKIAKYLLPAAYRKVEGKYVTYMRMRKNVSHTNFPTVRQLILNLIKYK